MAAGDEELLQAWCRQLPKAELHAHLNGSVSTATVKKLVKLHASSLSADFASEACMIAENESRTLDECFKLFGVMHRLVCDVSSLKLVTEDVIREFAEDGVKYLELRTTPRENEEVGMTRTQYVDTVLDTMAACEALHGIVVRLLLSINRQHSAQQAMEAVALAVANKHRGVVGIDLSGNPNCGDAADFIEALVTARQQGLKIAVHVAEVDRPRDTGLLLATRPDRLGHATFVNHKTLETAVPVEICLTSNVKCRTVASYADHHVGDIIKRGRLFALCTDDKGIFGSNLSQEYALAAKHFGLGKSELWDIAIRGVGYGFAEQDVLARLSNEWEQLRAADAGS
eukprot:m.78696 g.78696  ORF g.78696 m.78696 type:complete len:342 (+) comp14594_c0_seq2:116-1141(+)